MSASAWRINNSRSRGLACSPRVSTWSAREASPSCNRARANPSIRFRVSVRDSDKCPSAKAAITCSKLPTAWRKSLAAQAEVACSNMMRVIDGCVGMAVKGIERRRYEAVRERGFLSYCCVVVTLSKRVSGGSTLTRPMTRTSYRKNALQDSTLVLMVSQAIENCSCQVACWQMNRLVSAVTSVRSNRFLTQAKCVHQLTLSLLDCENQYRISMATGSSSYLLSIAVCQHAQ